MVNAMRKTIIPSRTYYESLDVIIDRLRQSNEGDNDTILIKKFIYHKTNFADKFTGISKYLPGNELHFMTGIIFLFELTRFCVMIYFTTFEFP